MTLLITNALVATMTEPNRVIENGAILIRDGAIADLGTSQEVQSGFARAPASVFHTLDTRGQLVLPGGICAHTHFYGAFARGMAVPGEPPRNFVEILERLWWRLDRALDLEAVRYSALVCLIDAIRNGTTTLIDHHASPNAIEGSLEAISEAVEQSGLRAALCYEVTDRNGLPGAEAGIRENATFARSVRRRESDRVRAALGIHASLTVGDATLDRCVQAAQDADVPLHLHVAEDAADQADSIGRYGMRVVARLAARGALTDRTLCAHCVHVDGQEIELLAQARAKAIHQPRSNMNNGVGVAPIPAMLRAGVRVGLGNDGFSNDGFAEMKAADAVQKLFCKDPSAMGADDILRIAYANNAGVARLFWPETAGVLEVGAPADLILLEYHPFTPLTASNLPWHMIFGLHGGLVTHTICGGRVLMQDRQLVTLDEEAICARAREVAARTWQRL